MVDISLKIVTKKKYILYFHEISLLIVVQSKKKPIRRELSFDIEQSKGNSGYNTRAENRSSNFVRDIAIRDCIGNNTARNVDCVIAKRELDMTIG